MLDSLSSGLMRSWPELPAPMPLLLSVLALLSFGEPERTVSGPPQHPEPIAAPAPLVLRVDMPALAPAGMPIPFRLTLANGGERPVRVELDDRPVAFDLVVRTADGAVVWRRLQARPADAKPVARTLSPREVLTFEGRWDQRDSQGRPVPSGVYTVRGVLPVAGVAGGWGSPPREVTIIP